MAFVTIYEKLLIFLFFSTTCLSHCNGNDILGCGGFVKSHVNLDFSKIEIGLYTKEGTLKEKTECAPKNGYYFLPLYDKGDYILKIHPPAGWSFEPAEVDITVDGTSDQCSAGQDINFSFNGFGITGRIITAGQKKGPEGVSIQLLNEKGEARNTVTAVGGEFHFTPIVPGKYTVKASHPRWKIEPAQTTVQVKEGNTALPVGSLIVKGYDVTGSVTSFGNPLPGLHVLLYSKEDNQKFRVEGCKTALLQGVADPPICFSVTDTNGEFTFGLVPAGEYKLVALAKTPGQSIVTFNVKPTSLKFTVQHDSQYIKNAFEVNGFTIVGTVLAAPGGSPITGARVSLDGKPVSNTDLAGKFTLQSLQPGTYSVIVHHELCEFEQQTVTIAPNGIVSLRELYPAKWKVCGSVTPAAPRRIIIKAELGPFTKTISISKEGNWCTYLPPGVYSVKVEVTDEEQNEGLQFYPATEKVSVSHAPVSGVSFSQLKAAASGEVQCVGAVCRPLSVTLRSLAADGRYIGQPITVDVVDGAYTFPAVAPGRAEVRLEGGRAARLCWEARAHSVTLTPPATRLPPLVHTGYALDVHLTHDADVEYKCGEESGTWSLGAGSARVCVRHAGTCTLRPKGCHLFDAPSKEVDVAADGDDVPSVSFEAVAHASVVSVRAPTLVQDLTLRVMSDKGVDDIGPLAGESDGGEYVYSHTLYLKQGEAVVVSMHSSRLLSEPAAPQQLLGASRCRKPALRLAARKAKTLTGRTVPPVAGAVVTLTADGADDFKMSYTTGADGKYEFGPLDASRQYTIEATKESYAMGPVQENGDIPARQLASILVEVQDQDGAPLEGALVSLSGAGYRRTAATEAGVLRFTALAPGEYFLKPLLKEYKFEPPHRALDVAEGAAHKLTLRGTRVAWSALGRVVSLSGEGRRAPVLVRPVSSSNPECLAQDATPDVAGHFRIRGLLPECRYTVELKESNDPELFGLKLAIPPPLIDVRDKKDVTDLRLVVVQRQRSTDASVTVRASSIEFAKSLRLRLSRDDATAEPVFTARVDSTNALLPLPRLPADNSTYLLTLESSLSKATHVYEEQNFAFVADGAFKHFEIEFAPKVKSSEQELRHTSLALLPVLALALLAAFGKGRAQLRALLPLPKPAAPAAQPERRYRKKPHAA